MSFIFSVDDQPIASAFVVVIDQLVAFGVKLPDKFAEPRCEIGYPLVEGFKKSFQIFGVANSHLSSEAFAFLAGDDDFFESAGSSRFLFCRRHIKDH